MLHYSQPCQGKCLKTSTHVELKIESVPENQKYSSTAQRQKIEHIKDDDYKRLSKSGQISRIMLEFGMILWAVVEAARILYLSTA